MSGCVTVHNSWSWQRREVSCMSFLFVVASVVLHPLFGSLRFYVLSPLLQLLQLLQLVCSQHHPLRCVTAHIGLPPLSRSVWTIILIPTNWYPSLHTPILNILVTERSSLHVKRGILITQLFGGLLATLTCPFVYLDRPYILCPDLDSFFLSFFRFRQCCFVLLTRGWGRLETRPPVALGSSPELSSGGTIFLFVGNLITLLIGKPLVSNILIFS